MSPVIRFCLDLFRRCEIRLALERIYIIAKLLDPFIPLYPDLDFVFFSLRSVSVFSDIL